MGRPKKFPNGYTNISFKIDPKLAEIAKQKTKNEGTNLSKILRSYLKTYTELNGSMQELKEKRQKVSKKVEEEKQKLEALGQKIEKEKERIPAKYVDYYKRELSGDYDEDKIEKRMKTTADKLGLSLDEFKERLLEKIGDEIDGY